MQVDDIQVGQTLQGKGGDADKARLVISIDARRREAVTEVYRDGKSIGQSTISLFALAQWAAEEVTHA